MRMFFDATGSAMHWAERQPPLELAASGLAHVVVLYVVLMVAEGPRG